MIEVFVEARYLHGKSYCPKPDVMDKHLGWANAEYIFQQVQVGLGRFTHEGPGGSPEPVSVRSGSRSQGHEEKALSWRLLYPFSVPLSSNNRSLFL